MLHMMAEAAQTYGIVLVNTSSGVTFYGENWHDGDTDIYGEPGGLFGGLKPWQFMVDLPWEHMQALREDVHRPGHARRDADAVRATERGHGSS